MVLWDIRSNNVLIEEKALGVEENQDCARDSEEGIGLASADQKEMI